MENISNPNDYIAERIVALRHEHNYSLSTVVTKLETHGIYYSKGRLSLIENKHRPAPALLLVGLKLVYGCKYSDFYIGLESKIKDIK